MSFMSNKFGSLDRRKSPSKKTKAIPPVPQIADQQILERMSPMDYHINSSSLKRPSDAKQTQYQPRKKKKKPYIYQGVNVKNDLLYPKTKDAETETSSLQPASPISTGPDQSLKKGTGWDDSDIGLINIDKIHNSQKPQADKNGQLVHIEGLIDLSDCDRAMSDDHELADLLDGKDIMDALQNHRASRVDLVKEKYKEWKLPPIIKLRRELMRRADQYMHVIPQILRGEIETSYYYDLANRQYKSSSSSTLSASERVDFDWQPYFGGYIGFERQLIIGQIIANRCRKELAKAATRNKTVSYWTGANFATYVLANEIIIRMTMEDMHCNFSKAEGYVTNSKDYGIFVADIEPIANDVDSSELLREMDFDKTEANSGKMLDDILNNATNSDLNSDMDDDLVGSQN